jgi:hypothetical protein
MNEIGKSRVVLRLYLVKGEVSLNTLVVARYDRSVFNMVVVAQRNMRNTRKRPGHAETPHEACRNLSRMFRTFSVISGVFRPEAPGGGQPLLIFAIGYRRQGPGYCEG